MLTDNLLAVVLAVCSAVCIALGAVLRQRSARAEAAGEARSVLLQPVWWLGNVTGLAGYGFQAVAMAFGPILLVQPVLITSLLFVLPLGMLINRARPTSTQWIWALSLTCVVGLLVALADPRPGNHHFASEHWFITALTTAVLIGGAAWAILRSRGRTRAIALGAISGGLFGIVAVLTKTVAARVHHLGAGTLLTSVEVLALVAVAAAAYLAQHFSYQAGELRASFPAALLTEQAVAAVLGIVALGETLDAGPVEQIVLILGVVFACFATVRLASVDEPGEPQRAL